MKFLVVYDSNYGNTKKIAETISSELDSMAICISELDPNGLCDYDLLVVGMPIIGWKPTVKMQEFLSKLQKGQLNGIKVTTFDTRVKLFIHGDAMNKVADSLKNAGADVIVSPMPFYVAGPQSEPKLLEGEIEKAKEWARTIKAKL